jgi:hypothetical protein
MKNVQEGCGKAAFFNRSAARRIDRTLKIARTDEKNFVYCMRNGEVNW